MKVAIWALVFACAVGLSLAWPQVNLEPETNCYEDACPDIPFTQINPAYAVPANSWTSERPNDIMGNTPVASRLFADLTENFGLLRKGADDYHVLQHNGSSASLKIWLGIHGCATQNINRKVEVGVFASASFPAAAESVLNVPASAFALASVPAGYRLVGSMVVDTRNRAPNRFVPEDGIHFYAPATFAQGCAVAPSAFGPPQPLCDFSAAIHLNTAGVILPADTLVIVVQEALGKSRTPYNLVTGEIPPFMYKLFQGVTDEILVRNYYHYLEVGKLIYGNRQHKAYCDLE